MERECVQVRNLNETMTKPFISFIVVISSDISLQVAHSLGENELTITFVKLCLPVIPKLLK